MISYIETKYPKLYKVLSWILGFCVAALSIWSNVDPDNGILSKCWQFWLILLFSILAGGCQWRQSILDTKTKNIVDDLKRKLDQANLEISSLLLIKQNIGRIFQCCLQDIANALKFTTQERISLYIILDDEFALCSRISSNPSSLSDLKASSARKIIKA